MPPSTSQVKLIYLPGIGETRMVTLLSMRDMGGHLSMTFLRYYSSLRFHGLVPNFRFIMVTLHPFFWYICIFYWVFWHTYYTCPF